MTINSLIQDHIKLKVEMDKLEDETFELSRKILKEAETLSKEELIEIYPKIKDNELKYRLYLKIKKMKTE